ncbi:hypothetical protein P171DRAFT_331918, partial [Karstenula rhodostoma CBS 690.94]
VHEKVLSATSAFFKAVTRREWDGSRRKPGTIDLGDERFDIVNSYVHWLYTGDLVIPTDEKNDLHTFLSEAYVFGEKILDSNFKNGVLDSIIIETNRGNRPSTHHMNTIFDGTVSGSPARRFVIDVFLYKGHGSKAWAKAIEELTEDAARETLLAVVCERRPPEGPPWE